MIINHNITALNTHRQLGNASNAQANSMEKLSSGLRINSAKDDAAGLAISEKMRGQIRGLEQASSNAQDGISLMQTAEGALNETHSILQRMNELAVQSANGTNTDTDRGELQKEIDQLAEEITRISSDTEFNTQALLDGKFEAKFHIGANTGQNISLSINKMDSLALGVGSNELATEDLTVSNSALVTANSVLADDVDKTYSVVKLDAATDVGGASGVSDANYVMKDSDGNVVAASTDGSSYTFANVTNSGLSNDAALTDFGTGVVINFGGSADGINKITSGELVVADGTSASVDYSVSNTVSDSNIKLGSGTYTVVAGSGRADVNTTNQVLVNKETNEVVAVGDHATASTSWKSLDGATTLMTTSADLSTGDEINVAGQGGIDVSSQEAANSAIKTIQSAIETVSSERSKLGAMQNRLDHTINNLNTSSENLTAAESRIRDVDYAEAA